MRSWVRTSIESRKFEIWTKCEWSRESKKLWEFEKLQSWVSPVNLKTQIVQHTPVVEHAWATSNYLTLRPIIKSVSRVKSAPCSGFVIGSAHICWCTGQPAPHAYRITTRTQARPALDWPITTLILHVEVKSHSSPLFAFLVYQYL